MKKKIFCLFVVIFLQACSSQTIDIKSPCVSRDGGPCGPKKPINDWWLKDASLKQDLS